jgi:hypothetical protein
MEENLRLTGVGMDGATTFSIMTLSITTLSITPLSIITLSTMCCYAESLACSLSFMLSVTNKPFILSVVMLNVFILSVAMLNVIKLSVVIMNVIAPHG